MRGGIGFTTERLVLSALLVLSMVGCSSAAENRTAEPEMPAATESTPTDTAPAVTEPTETATPSATTPTQGTSTSAVPIGQGANKDNFERLLMDLVYTYETPSAESTQALDNDLAAIQATNAEDFAVAQSIVTNWNSVFANPNYPICMYSGGEQATELMQTGLQDSSNHAFVVLGYELVNGEMTAELQSRCDAAAAAARSFPSAIIVCSGGATGTNNPEGHTEAGMMRDYLVQTCGIDSARIHIDETAQDTAQNATNTLRILRDNGIQAITVVTSSYHQGWVQAVLNAAAALSARDFGVTVAITGNYSVDYPLTEIAPGTEDRVAIEQVADVLGLPKDEMQTLLWS